MAEADKPLVWLHGEIKTPPFATQARIEAGIRDGTANWRIVYRTDGDAIVIGEVFVKKTRTTPKDVIAICQKRFREYDDACK